MNLNLRSFETFPVDITMDVEADNIDLGVEGITFKDLINVKLTIQKVKEEYYCQGYVFVPIQAECSRCLTLFDSELTGELNFVVKPTESKAIIATDPAEEVIVLKDNQYIVELDELIREALLINVPMKSLCNVECKGICPNCGVNLNEETCDCKNKEMDDRWEGLKDLLE